MSTQKVFVLICVLVLSLQVEAGKQMGHAPHQETTEHYSSSWDQKSTANVDFSSEEKPEDKMVFLGSPMLEMMRSCNETFNTPMEYVKELNETGRYPSKANNDSKCYIFCVLEQLGVVDAKGAPDVKNAETWFPDNISQNENNSLAKRCADPNLRKEKEACDKAYNFIMCLFSDKKS